jgi:hypothetical protein
VGPAGASSPPYRCPGSSRHHRYYDPLRLPNVHLDSVSAADTLSCSSVSYLIAGRKLSAAMPGFFRFSAGRLTLAWLWTRRSFGSPRFPSYPFVHMPWSQTPAVSRTLAMAHPGLLPSANSTASAFVLHSRIYPSGPQLYIFRGSIHGLHTCSVRLQTPVTGLACGLRY